MTVDRPRTWIERAAAAGVALAVAGTYFAARLDFVRRHRPNMTPDVYWMPQLTHIWLPGIGIALTFGVIGALAHVLRRR